MTTGEHGTDPSGYAIVNVMVPRRYFPEWQGNVFERRATSIARQLCGEGMVIDFDQLLAKQPGRDDAVFGWHQDQAYWIDTDDRRTATCWLAVDDSTVANGCMQFLPGQPPPAGAAAPSPPWRPRHEPHAGHGAASRRRDGSRADRPRRHHRAQRGRAARIRWEHDDRLVAACLHRGVAFGRAPSAPSGRSASRTRTTTTSNVLERVDGLTVDGAGRGRG